MKFTFDFLNVNYGVFLASSGLGEVLRVNKITSDDLKDRVPSPSTFLIALPGVFVPLEAVEHENIITVVLAAPPEEKAIIKHSRLFYQLMLSKAIACDYVTWEALNRILPLNKANIRWIDITGCALMNGAAVASDRTKTDVYYFGNPQGTFADFMEGSLILRERLDCSKIVYRDPYTFHGGDINYSRNTLAITPFSHSRAFMDTLANFFDFVLYPVTGDNGNHISGLDSRGATSILANVANLEKMGAGRQKATISTWDDLFFNVRTMVKSMDNVPHLSPNNDNIIVRLFHEISRSSF